MTLRWIEGFETYDTTTGSTIADQLSRKYGNFQGLTLYPVYNAAILAVGRNGGYSLQGGSSQYTTVFLCGCLRRCANRRYLDRRHGGQVRLFFPQQQGNYRYR